MSDAKRLNRVDADEPAPQFATAADIMLADELRRQLERRYFGGGIAPAPPAANDDGNA